MIKNRFLFCSNYLNWGTFKHLVTSVQQRRLTGLSAEMAYHAMLALFPAILAIIITIGLLEESVKITFGRLAVPLENLVPEQVWVILLNFVQEVKLTEGGSWVSISFIAAIWVFSGVLSAAMEALDQIHQVSPENKRVFWLTKIIAICLSIGTIILLIVSSFLLFIGDWIIKLALEQNWNFLLFTFWQILSGPVIMIILVISLSWIYKIYKLPSKKDWWKFTAIAIIAAINTISLRGVDFFIVLIRNLIETLEINQTVASIILNLWRFLSLPVALLTMATAFAFIYYFGCSKRQKNTPILPGAIIAAILWAVLSSSFRLYVANFGQYNKVYGAVGAVIVLMLWLYLSCFVILLGEQFNVTMGEHIRLNSQQN